MAQFVAQGVKELQDDPDAKNAVELVLGHEEEAQPRISEWVEAHGGRVKQTLPFDMLHAEVPETAVAELCECSGIESVEFNNSIEVLSSGNRHTHTG